VSDDSTRLATSRRCNDYENFLPFRVGLEFIWKTVLAGVQLGVQLRLLAKEIQIVIAEGRLASELVTAETPAKEDFPPTHAELGTGSPQSEPVPQFHGLDMVSVAPSNFVSDMLKCSL
jgi:hypothetical protein